MQSIEEENFTQQVNLAEWTNDIFASTHAGILNDGSACTSVDRRYQTVGEGGWREDKLLTRSTMRRRESANRNNVDHVGFRFCYLNFELGT